MNQLVIALVTLLLAGCGNWSGHNDVTGPTPNPNNGGARFHGRVCVDNPQTPETCP